MKTVVIIVSVLAVSALALNKDTLNRFNDNFKKCAEEKGKPMEPTVEMMLCVTEKEGKLLNGQGEMQKDVIMTELEELIGDAGNLQKAKDLVGHCFDEASQKGLKGPDMTKSIIECGISVVSYFKE